MKSARVLHQGVVVDPAPGAQDSASEHRRLGRAAVVALYDELALWPKPGLVSFVDRGSHADMDAGTFLRSLFALRRYFSGTAALGEQRASFHQLNTLGRAAEVRMLTATGGVNTHRGAVFMLGLLCAAAGAIDVEGGRSPPRPSSGAPGSCRGLAGAGRCTAHTLRAALIDGWGQPLRDHAARRRGTNGSRAAATFGLRGAADEAALGFPVLFDHAWPALRRARAQGLDDRHARLQALFTAIAALDDTTLAHRGCLAGLRFGQAAARAFLAAGGAARPDAIQHARSLHAAFVHRRLSPGGAADVLAAACWLERVCGEPAVVAAPDPAAR